MAIAAFDAGQRGGRRGFGDFGRAASVVVGVVVVVDVRVEEVGGRVAGALVHEHAGQ